MGFHPSNTGADAHCSSLHSGHGLCPLRLRGALADATVWEPVHVVVSVPEQRVVIHTGDGRRLRFHTHDAFRVEARLASWRAGEADHGRAARPGAASRPCVWNGRADILGLPADTARHAGRGYVSLARERLAPCGFDHDAGLATAFDAATAGLRDHDPSRPRHG